MSLIVAFFNEIWDEILSEKIIKKNNQYGDSLEEPLMIFNDYPDIQQLVDIRIDDKLSRIRVLPCDDPKYWSELKEIVAYMVWKLYLKMRQDKRDELAEIQRSAEEAYDNALCGACKHYDETDDGFGYCYYQCTHVNSDEWCKKQEPIKEEEHESCSSNSGQPRIEVQSTQDTREIVKRNLPNVTYRGLYSQ
jgi:hypothetical protein